MRTVSLISVLIYNLVFFLSGQSAHAQEVAWTAELVEAATGWEVLALTETGGEVREGGRTRSFAFITSQSADLGGNAWTIGLIRFPDEEMRREALTDVETGGACSPGSSPILVAVRNDATEGYARVLDESAVGCEAPAQIEYGDFIGTGHEISFSLRLLYCDASQSRWYSAVRKFVFGVPTLEPLVGLTSFFEEHPRSGRENVRVFLQSRKTPNGSRRFSRKGDWDFQEEWITADTPKAERLQEFVPAFRAVPTISEEVLTRATGWGVMDLKDGAGTATIDGQKTPFEIVESVTTYSGDERWYVLVVRFNRVAGAAGLEMEKFLRGASACPGERTPVLIAMRPDGGTCHVVSLDDAFGLSRVMHLEHGDFLGSGSELMLAAGLSFCDVQHARYMQMGRRYVFSFPELKVLMALDEGGMVFEANGKEQVRALVYPVTTEEGARAVGYQEGSAGKRQTLTFSSPEHERVRPVLLKYSADLAPTLAKAGPPYLNGRLVDQYGTPLEGFEIKFSAGLSPPMALAHEFEQGVAETTSGGFFRVPVGYQVQLELVREGFRKEFQSFCDEALYRSAIPASMRNLPIKRLTSGERLVPEDTIDVVFERIDEEVEVLQTREWIDHRLFESAQLSHFSIRLPERGRPEISNPVDDIDSADIVFEFRRPSGSPSTATSWDWDISIYGRNGWKLVPESYSMQAFAPRRAPAEGYYETWGFTDQTLPKGFFVSLNDDERYGVVLLWLSKESTRQSAGGGDQWRVSCRYLVQACPLGTRSLEHEWTPGGL